MKKEYLILIALILILGAYLLIHKENQNNYVLPKIEKIDISKITGLIIDKKQNSMQFIKKEKTWVDSEKGYPLDSASIEKILETLKTFKLSALVSQKEDLNRYELDEDHQIGFKAMNGQQIVFEFTMGKTAPSFNHTFVKLAADKNIYHANGSFRPNFDKSLDDFRDKKVMEFKEGSIQQISIEKDGLSKTINSTEVKKEQDKNTKSWHSDDGTAVDSEKISSLVSAISFLECEKYLPEETKNQFENKPSLCKIMFKNENNMALNLFKTDTQDDLIGISSMNEYVFAINQFTGKEILSDIDHILGITKAEKNEN